MIDVPQPVVGDGPSASKEPEKQEEPVEIASSPEEPEAPELSREELEELFKDKILHPSPVWNRRKRALNFVNKWWRRDFDLRCKECGRVALLSMVHTNKRILCKAKIEVPSCPSCGPTSRLELLPDLNLEHANNCLSHRNILPHFKLKLTRIHNSTA